MIQDSWELVRLALGIDDDTLSAWQVGLRALVIYVMTLIMIRVGGGNRLLGSHAAIDVVLGIIFGSVLSRAVNGTAPFFETLAAGAILIALHLVFAHLAFHSHVFGKLVKGTDHVVIRDGEFQRGELARHAISERDVMAALRTKYKIDDPTKIKVGRIERNGEISGVVHEPRVIEIKVEAGVQTVRIELD
ncbi:MAG TPA: YetF domain-containing protein [Roseiflexaceae bacterium]|nr:YetF domain-containing protein [Roseiflexaceae bacterium]